MRSRNDEEPVSAKGRTHDSTDEGRAVLLTGNECVGKGGISMMRSKETIQSMKYDMEGKRCEEFSRIWTITKGF